MMFGNVTGCNTGLTFPLTAGFRRIAGGVWLKGRYDQLMAADGSDSACSPFACVVKRQSVSGANKTCLWVFMGVCLSPSHLLFCLPICLSVCLSICAPVYLVCLLYCLSVSLFHLCVSVRTGQYQIYTKMDTANLLPSLFSTCLIYSVHVC